MALTLTAEQKSIEKIFSGTDKYIIPAYQRAYSWDIEQCGELFEDIQEAFMAYIKNESEGYFIGNIVIAKSNENENTLEVIDGQQRLITLTLFIKVLLELDSENSALEDAIWIKDRRNKSKKEQRVQTRVFDDKDSTFLANVLTNDLEQICKAKGTNNFIKNICFFHKQLKNTIQENKDFDIEEFINFLLDNVTLLPIESTDTHQDKARDKALKIFETINNRGRPLTDSDIFKANLYSMALEDGEQSKFIDLWKKLDYECDSINLVFKSKGQDKGTDILRIFKIYSYMIRGKEGIKSSEMGLRDFFTKQKYSPFKNKSYIEIMNDLFDILKAIQVYEKIIINTSDNNQLSKYFQLIDIYTNNYPKDLLIIFLVQHKNKEDISKIFLESLVRYCYFQGSTTRIKWTIYSWTIDVINNKEITYYPKDYTDRDYTFGGRLYKGFGLLSTYLNEDIESIYPYHIKRLRDVTKFKYPDYSYYDKIGHTVVTNMDNKILEKFDFEKFDELLYLERIKKIEKKLIEFFRNSNED